jgi:hypothetical protein
MYFNGQEAYFHDTDTPEMITNHFNRLELSIQAYRESLNPQRINELQSILQDFTFYGLDEDDKTVYDNLIKKELDYVKNAQSNMVKTKLNSFFALLDYMERHPEVPHSFHYKAMIRGEGSEQETVGWQGQFKGVFKNILNHAGNMDDVGMFFFQIEYSDVSARKEDLPQLDLKNMKSVVNTIEHYFMLGMSRNEFIEQFEHYEYHAKNITKFKKSF